MSKPLPETPWPVAPRNLLTENEQSLYQRLLALYPNHKVFVQVALSQLLDVPEDHPERMSIRGRFKQLVADFVLCRSDLSVVAVIELDDTSHERADRQGADARKNKALADAGIRLVRIPAGALPSQERLRMMIDAAEAAGIRAEEGPGPRFVGTESGVRLTEEWGSVRAESLVRPADSRGAEMRELKWGAVKILFLGVVLIGAWWLFTRLLPSALHLALQPLALPHNVTKPSMSASGKLGPSVISNASVGRGLSVEELAERKQVEVQAAATAKKQKDQAWAAFYAAPAACEHPADWDAQVECGNRYMRAKKEFEQRWMLERAGAQGIGGAVVLDNEAVRGAGK